MRKSDPLAGLDAVEWTRLRHAYGTAGNVPGLLRALMSPDENKRENARSALHDNVCHQGRRYEAAAPTVPFLLAIAADRSMPDRAELLQLVSELAVGWADEHLPLGVDIKGWRRELAKMHAADPRKEQRGACDEGLAFDDFQESLHETTVALAAYDAVRAGLPTVHSLLSDPDSSVRATAAYLLGWFPEEAAASTPPLRALWNVETVPAVTVNAIISLGLLSDGGLIDRMRDQLTGDEPLARYGAAIALIRMGVTDAAVIAELATACTRPPEADGPGFLGWDLRAYASESLGMLDGAAPAEAVDSVLDGLSRSSDFGACPVAAAALRLTFGAPPRPSLPPLDQLTPLQRRTVRTLASLPETTWHILDFRELLEAWGVSGDRDTCRRYAGLA
ncbi:HEAT repeat domain-containing protein [Actinomadura nitritigenes]|uniref:HEAT repeat domain-containing protein n=1 Tax=Actinomadura nitritigenes TaxID=134602 RepID=UPI00368B0C4E